MALPIFAPFPPIAIQASFPREEWKQCLEAWITLSSAYLQTDDRSFKHASEQKSFSAYLKSFYEQWSHTSVKNGSSTELDQLVRQCFSLVARCSSSNSQHAVFADLDFLSCFARAHVRNALAKKLLAEIWSAKHSPFQKSLQKWKISVARELETGSMVPTSSSLSSMTPLLYACGEAASSLMTGSDFLEALTTAYKRDHSPSQRRTIVLITYIGLTALVKDGRTSATVLADHTYSLKAQADSDASAPSLLHDIITNTPMLKALKRYLNTSDASPRIKQLADALATYRTPSIARKKRVPRMRGKGKQISKPDHQEVHVHRMSLVTQVQDLFPDLGAGFVMKLLDEYSDDVEQVTAHLLDGSLPAHLVILDRSEQSPVVDPNRSHVVDHLAPRSTPPPPSTFIPHRANIFDNDDFDRLEIDTSKLHIGKREHDGEHGYTDKAAILSALAAFDADDDERDDTYDVEDVGGTVDGEHHDGDSSAMRLAVEESDLILYKHYQVEPGAFSRSAETRRGKARANLKVATGMTDEAIEGWAIMLQRDPKRANRFAMETTKFSGLQNELARTAYRAQAGESEAEDSDAGQPRRTFRGRGRGRSSMHGRGGNVAGPSGEASTAAAQRRKETNKSSRANHNRRNQRAKKMARGGFSGPS